MSETQSYRTGGVTVWFAAMPKVSPFVIESEFGPAMTVGRGNAFDERDIYRNALEAIIEEVGFGAEYDIAEKALADVDA